MFFGRKRELYELTKLYCNERFEFAVIYGRRRVGKTALINEFISDKRAIYFTGVETNEKQNLENLSRNILSFENNPITDISFPSFQSAIDRIFKLSQNEKIVFVIDEYPYVAKASKSLASTLQLLIDKNKEDSNLLLIICGSSMSYMEDNVFAYKAPLYGRFTAQIKINPFEFKEVCYFLKGFTHTNKAILYGMVGGTPQYILQISDRFSVENNIKNTFLNSTSFLFEEPTNILKQEIREPAVYNAIISAIANGHTKMSEISTKIGEETAVCATYIKNLIALNIIKKENPVGEKTTRKTVYSIEDNMFRFWYRFVPENHSIISRGATELCYNRIEPHISEYMGEIFEEICRQYLWSELVNGNSPIDFSEIGRWWGLHPHTKTPMVIPIMAISHKNHAIFADCIWSEDKVDLPVLETLIDHSEIFPHTTKHFYLFSKSGFTRACMDKVNALSNVNLVNMGNM